VDLIRLDSVEQRVRAALAAIADGRPVVVADDVDRENEGDLIFAASLATPALVAFTVRHTSGFVCVALPGDECDRLGASTDARQVRRPVPDGLPGDGGPAGNRHGHLRGVTGRDDRRLGLAPVGSR
jgi:3,4-dihydroxy-2-butanone 4-phosphate synthase